ncbi:MAG: hypothetical protein DRQ65_09110, partial [Gammaproteobacteria bacterium]
LPEHLLAELKLLANKRDVPYQSLLKLYLAERVEEVTVHSPEPSLARTDPVDRQVRDIVAVAPSRSRSSS